MTQHAFSNNLDHHGSKVQYLDLMDVLGQLCYPVSFDKLECLAHAFCIICSWKLRAVPLKYCDIMLRWNSHFTALQHVAI